MNEKYDAVLLVSFGGPEGMDDVMPFLENVLRGKNVPQERMLEVAEHYKHFDGISPINEQNRQLLQAIRAELDLHQINLPVYWGNRNWHPMLADTLQQMKKDGVHRAMAFFTSMYSCYSGCRQYRENIAQAQQEIGTSAPHVQKVRMAFNHPLYIEAITDRLQTAFSELRPLLNEGGANAELPASNVEIIFTAHSIPQSMADGCKYETQLKESCRLVMEQFPGHPYNLVYQSRSGPPQQPWLEPDICHYLEQRGNQENRPEGIIIVPIGFISDHMEVLFDLDTEAKAVCDRLEIPMVRAKTVGIHPKFVSMIRELIQEQVGNAPKRAIGCMPPNWDVCPIDCCTYSPSRGR